jgi:hypothetical protein
MEVPKPAKKPKKGKPTQRTVRSITMASTTSKRGEARGTRDTSMELQWRSNTLFRR